MEQDLTPDVLIHPPQLAWMCLATRQIIVNLIGETTTKTGLKIHAALDEGQYPT